MQDLGTLPGGEYSYSFALSADGSSVTGYSGSSVGEHAFRWVSGVMHDLPTLDSMDASGGLAVSADGSVIAGYSGSHAVRWSHDAVEDLGVLTDGSFSMAYAVSGDGRFAGGSGDDATGLPLATLWSAELGLVDLNVYLPTLGVDLTGWTLTTTAGLSFDGTTVVGVGTYNGEDRGWVVTIPTPGAATLLGVGGLVAVRRRRN